MINLLSIIIRTMPGRERFLDRCLFNLSWQKYSPVELVIVAQGVNSFEEFDNLRTLISLWQKHFQTVQIMTHFSKTDARSKSLNLGLEAASGRYLAFLDDDDKVYPAHYQTLIKALSKSNNAWAYCDTIRALYNKEGQLISRSMPFHQSKYFFISHLRDNFIPIHAFIIDKLKVALKNFDEDLSVCEDYDFLLHLAKEHAPVYVPEIGSEYCIRNDGSNTVQDGTLDKKKLEEKTILWEKSRILLKQKKEKLVGWWIEELDFCSLETELTKKYYRNILNEHYNSKSWKLTKPLRNLILWYQHKTPEKLHIPQTEQQACMLLLQLLKTNSWEITAPLRLLSKVLRCTIKTVFRLKTYFLRIILS